MTKLDAVWEHVDQTAADVSNVLPELVVVQIDLVAVASMLGYLYGESGLQLVELEWPPCTCKPTKYALGHVPLVWS